MSTLISKLADLLNHIHDDISKTKLKKYFMKKKKTLKKKNHIQ